MSLQDRLQEDLKTALKSGQKDRLQVIRMLLSDVKNRDLMPQKPTEEQVVEVYGKKLRKSIEEYEKINRLTEVAQLKSELAVVEEYLPKKASAEETEKLVDVFLAGNAFTEKQVGQATGAFLKAHGGQVDGSLVNPLMRKKLAGK
ncbi:MAG: GatB/YqeY domain-containing protein [Tepidisphaeraceae bacterium]